MGCCCSSEERGLDTSITQRTTDYVRQIQRNSFSSEASTQIETISTTSDVSNENTQGYSRGKRKLSNSCHSVVSKKLCLDDGADYISADGNGRQKRSVQWNGHEALASQSYSCKIDICIVPLNDAAALDVTSSKSTDVLSSDDNIPSRTDHDKSLEGVAPDLNKLAPPDNVTSDLNHVTSLDNLTPGLSHVTPSLDNLTPGLSHATSLDNLTPGLSHVPTLADNFTPSDDVTPSLDGTPPSAHVAPTPVLDNLTPSAANITPSAANVTPSAANVTPSAANVTPSAANVTPSAANVTPSAANVTPSAANVTPSVGHVTPVGNSTPPTLFTLSLRSVAPILKQVTPPASNVTSLGCFTAQGDNAAPPGENKKLGAKKLADTAKKSQLKNSTDDHKFFLKQIGEGPRIRDPTLKGLPKHANLGPCAREWKPSACQLVPGVTKFEQRNPKSQYIMSQHVNYPHRLLNDPKPPLQHMTPLSTNLIVQNNRTLLYLDDNIRYENIAPGSSEFHDVRNHFKATTQSHYEVFQIYKVVNKWLLTLYMLKKEEYRILYGANNVKEHLLFHGTSKINGESICLNNFNWRCYKNDKIFGHGVNFSSISKYASHYSQDPEPIKVMFAATVIVCNKCDGSSSMLVPPYYDSGKSLRYDTTQKPDGHVQVKFNDDEFYPSYIIYFLDKRNINFNIC